MHRIMESSMLDCETIEQDVQFDDEWSLFKSLTGRKKQRASNPRVASLFGASPGSPTAAGFMQPSSAGRSGNRQSLQVDTRGDQYATATPSRAGRQGASMFTTENVDSPATMIDILSGTLLVLELYELNPALIIQIFSQLLCWMAAEMFNGIMLGGKKYLCRSKALQIKMNLELVAEWVKASSLPSTLYTKHFERILQLLQVGHRSWSNKIGRRNDNASFYSGCNAHHSWQTLTCWSRLCRNYKLSTLYSCAGRFEITAMRSTSPE